jgi:PAS domain S-box-containing protein
MNSTDDRLSAQLMAVEIISQILVSARPQDLGNQITGQLRELTGARTVMLLAHNKETDRHELLSVSPKRRSALFAEDELKCLCSASDPDDLPPLPEAVPDGLPIQRVLERAGIESILRYPLLAGRDRVGTLLLLDMPGIDRIHETHEVMHLLAPPISLALKNSLAYRRIEQQAEEKNRYLAEIIERSRNEIYVFDSETLKFIYVNRAALENLRYGSEEMAGMTPLDIKPEMTDESFLAAVKPLLEGTKDYYHFRAVHRRADGSDYPVDVNLQMVDDRGRRVFLAIIYDISEQKLLETQLQQAQKMESIGRLAGGVAHDFNNMLSVILGHAELGLMHLEPTNPVAANLREIKEAAERSADLTRQLLAFARKQTVAPKLLDLNDTVGSMLKMLQRLMGEDIRLHWSPAANLWKVKMDPSQVDQILANLCVNARDAIDGIGAVTIASENITVDGHYSSLHPDAVPGDFVRLTVSDTGKGVDAETMSHLFEPFFTTKAIGKGTGLGLATVYGAVRQNNGFVTVYSEVGKGTTFCIHIPRHAGEPADEKVETGHSAPVGGKETILVVEDEAAILEVSTLMLEMQGYTVLGASTPREALRLARSHAGPIHLVITDVILPQMNGKELFDTLSAGNPGLKGLYMSGYTADIIARHGVLDEGVHFIQKPFSLESLSRKVREVLEK